jgi:adenine deaminase
MTDMRPVLAVARGEAVADLVLRNARIVNVLSGEIHEGDVAIKDGLIAGIGVYAGPHMENLAGAYLVPSFIDGHIHLESTLLTPGEFARAVVPRGTGAVVCDPHEYANVLGAAGIEYLLEASAGLPLDVQMMMPSCVPATPFESPFTTIGPSTIAYYLSRRGVAGLAEMMNFPAVISGDETELAKLAAAVGRPVDGHAPGLTGGALNAYIAAGPSSDHECTSLEEAREKLRRGMHILLREGTAERNLRDLLPLVTPENAWNFSFATDDKHPAGLEDEGHIDHHLRVCVAAGLPPMTALQIATINPARHYSLGRTGAIAPGYAANLVVLDDLRNFHARTVYHRGAAVARDGIFLAAMPAPPASGDVQGSMRVAPFDDWAFNVPALPDRRIRVIEIVPGQILTRAITAEPRVLEGRAVSDPARDILKIAVIERHHATGRIGVGFVRGFGLQRGALASTVAHDAHNLIVVGTNDLEMTAAALHVLRMGGGQCAVEGGRIVAALPLPIAGLVSDQPLAVVRRQVDALNTAAAALGCTLAEPFMALSFLALSPIPALRVIDRGLFDSEHFELTSLFV